MIELLKALFAGVIVPAMMQVLNQLVQIWTKALTKSTKYVLQIGENTYSFAS